LDEMTRDAASRYRRDDVLQWVLEQHSEMQMPRRSQGRVPHTDPTSEEAHLMKWVQEQDPDAHTYAYSRRT
jgi:hypothetical protein